jgi:hypothetical protein
MLILECSQGKNYTLWPWKSLGGPDSPKYLPSLVKIHWRMLIVKCSQGWHAVKNLTWWPWPLTLKINRVPDSLIWSYSRSYPKLTQLIVKDDRKYWYRTKKIKQLSLIIILLNIAKLVMSCRKYCCYIHQGVPTIAYFLYL